MLPSRLQRLPPALTRLGEADVRVARSPRARALGLAHLDRPRRPFGLLLPGTRSVHTFGMRFALDLVWLDAAGRALRVDTRVPVRAVRSCRRARAVLELPAGGAAGIVAGAPLLAKGPA